MNKAILLRIAIRAMGIWILGLSLDNLGGLTCILLSPYSEDALYAVPKSALLLLGGIVFFCYADSIARWLEGPDSTAPEAALMRAWYQWCHAGCGVLLLLLYGSAYLFALAVPSAGFTTETTVYPPHESSAKPVAPQVSAVSLGEDSEVGNDSFMIMESSHDFTTRFGLDTKPPAGLVLFIGIARLLVLIRLAIWLIEGRPGASGKDAGKDYAHAAP